MEHFTAGIVPDYIGAPKDTYAKLFPAGEQQWDFTTLNTLMPHPHYAAQHYICILSPAEEKLQKIYDLIDEAHAMAKRRFERKHLK
ncbi:DUF6194 family protein [Chitinophaga sedimenti]|uniref:DUF6194 family protein n=1 Tax=Chitinophaga sedimenti TaxID=2033606 RepID=UPI0035561E56